MEQSTEQTTELSTELFTEQSTGQSIQEEIETKPSFSLLETEEIKGLPGGLTDGICGMPITARTHC